MSWSGGFNTTSSTSRRPCPATPDGSPRDDRGANPSPAPHYRQGLSIRGGAMVPASPLLVETVASDAEASRRVEPGPHRPPPSVGALVRRPSWAKCDPQGGVFHPHRARGPAGSHAGSLLVAGPVCPVGHRPHLTGCRLRSVPPLVGPPTRKGRWRSAFGGGPIFRPRGHPATGPVYFKRAEPRTPHFRPGSVTSGARPSSFHTAKSPTYSLKSTIPSGSSAQSSGVVALISR